MYWSWNFPLISCIHISFTSVLSVRKLVSHKIISVLIFLYLYHSWMQSLFGFFLCFLYSVSSICTPKQTFQVFAVPLSSYYISQPFCSPIPSLSSFLLLDPQSCCPFFVHPSPCHQAAFSLFHQIQLPRIPSSHPFHLFPFTQDSSPHPTLNYYLHSALAHLSLLEALLGTGSILFQVINGAGNPWWEAEFHISSTALQKYSITAWRLSLLPTTMNSDTCHGYWALGKTAHHSTHLSMEGLWLSFHKREIYCGDGSTITSMSQLEPAMEIWAKAEAKCARTAWERSIESLAIWAHGWRGMQLSQGRAEQWVCSCLVGQHCGRSAEWDLGGQRWLLEGRAVL